MNTVVNKDTFDQIININRKDIERYFVLIDKYKSAGQSRAFNIYSNIKFKIGAEKNTCSSYGQLFI